MNPETLSTNLAHFSGSDEYTRTSSRMVITEGVKYLAENAGAFWLIDLIDSHQITPSVGREPFQVWTPEASAAWAWVVVTEDEFWALRALRAPSNGNRVVHSKLLGVLGIDAADLVIRGEVVGYLRLLRARSDGVSVTQLARRGAGPVAWRLDPAQWVGESDLATLGRFTT